MGNETRRKGWEKALTLAQKEMTAKKKRQLKKHIICFVVSLTAVISLIIFFSNQVQAAGINIDISSGDGTEGSFGTIQVLLLFALIALAPSLLIMVTSFTRIVIVLSFLRNALGVQQTPPNQVVVGLALFLSLFIMAPVFSEMNEVAIQPYAEQQITQEQALEQVQVPLKEFMLKQTGVKELNLFLSISGQAETLEEINPESLTSLGIEVIVPAFITTELKKAFTMGFLLFIPFLIIDMVVSSTLMSMGMVMLPPSMIATPFKLMLFVVVDGWSLLIDALIKSFIK